MLFNALINLESFYLRFVQSTADAPQIADATLLLTLFGPIAESLANVVGRHGYVEFEILDICL